VVTSISRAAHPTHVKAASSKHIQIKIDFPNWKDGTHTHIPARHTNGSSEQLLLGR
jgi:hypothetical protein